MHFHDLKSDFTMINVQKKKGHQKIQKRPLFSPSIFFSLKEMTLELYMEPLSMVDQISACGLRHVGYGVPTELFVPLVAAYTEAGNGNFMVISW